MSTYTIDLGKVDANGRGRKVNRVTLDVDLRDKVNDTAPYKDIHLNECRRYTELSICGAVWNAAGTDHQQGGQCDDTIAELFPENPKVQRLVEIWKRWHLGGMRGGCVHQIAEKWGDVLLDDTKPKTHDNMAVWTRPGDHPKGLLAKACPTCGYKYGTAWLVEAMPAKVEEEVRVLCAALQDESEPGTPDDFASRNGIKATAERAPENPHMPDNRNADHWKVRLRHGGKSMTLYYSKGHGHNGEKPTALEVLGCMASDAGLASESFEDFCGNTGEDTDSRKAKRSYDATRRQTDGLKRLLGAELFEALLEETSG